MLPLESSPNKTAKKEKIPMAISFYSYSFPMDREERIREGKAAKGSAISCRSLSILSSLHRGQGFYSEPGPVSHGCNRYQQRRTSMPWVAEQILEVISRQGKCYKL
jgi:hypothetical protein